MNNNYHQIEPDFFLNNFLNPLYQILLNSQFDNIYDFGSKLTESERINSFNQSKNNIDIALDNFKNCSIPLDFINKIFSFDIETSYHLLNTALGKLETASLYIRKYHKKVFLPEHEKDLWLFLFDYRLPINYPDSNLALIFFPKVFYNRTLD